MSEDVSHNDFSIELFPPKGPKGRARLESALAELGGLNPAFFSVTFGAGGTTRSGTLDTVELAMDITGRPAAPHLSCIEGTRESIEELLDNYKAAGVSRIVALRGDLPEGMEKPGVFNHANELVSFIKERHGDDFHLEVGAYPEFHPAAASPETDIDNFVRKVRAGADSAITQYFYNADAYFNFVDEVAARGIDVPIVPGIMPINDFGQISRFSAMCGADIPRWVRQKMEGYGDDTASVRAFGRELVYNLCEQLLAGGAPGLHFYALNKAEPTATLWHDLKLPGTDNKAA
ncbi:methylenetetrahydrofolate reductase [NAD(P)H] [Salinisphaera sp. Q1T1-3]|uniref:methylenetetrahydrofolate reductase [NAD(P)H] n=1 Tax=Salinisphaera sp. Q1T1-3 TaxID=2321229 RepID=UPI000E714D07|nr:methylenetetrahydrofolate reductase [NAD(P)H] [Salinisphaera sp. Q1T1-3]RJS94354.1 methylenetetrahydrofolate reductase [NAD(P)H] [Salinisphaera sp. Q1T1-3]